MLNRVKLTNFQRHRALEVSFTGGLTALRGSNEAGKSTLLRGICYAMFGTKALAESLDETVTWGEAVNTLKVEVDVTIEGVAYSLKRSKAGAECNYDGGIVTGQTEVTAFVCRLLKVDAGAAARLMLSGQNEIRGALEAGPKATTELIEKLAEFDQLDNLIELMQEKLTLGSAASVEAALAGARTQLDAARAAAVPVDSAGLELRISEATKALALAEDETARAYKAEEAAQEAHGATRERIVKQQALVRDAARSAGNVQTLAAKLAELRAVKAPVNVGGDISLLESRIAEAGDSVKARAAWTTAKPYTAARPAPSPTETFGGTVDQLKSTLALGVADENAVNNQVTRLEGEIRLLNQSLTHGSCTFCGKDFSGVPEVAEKNKAIQDQLDEAMAIQVSQRSTLRRLINENEELRSIEMDSRPALRALAVVGDYARLADDRLPPVLVWEGPDVDGETVDVKALEREIFALQSAQRVYEAAVARADDVEAQLTKAQEEDSDLQDLLVSTPVETIGPVQDALDAARAASGAAQTARRNAEYAVRDAQSALRDANNTHAALVKLATSLEALVSERTAELATLAFNNALLKAVRAARPKIADRLWALVLSAVSTYFSEIRGVKSRVTKHADGFKVDGHPVTLCSGSTLDALGLAVRVALVRTFLPTAPFLILDEPCAAMDDGRTHNLLGFLATSGFQQILLVTHEDVSESVADNVIEL